MAPENYDEFLSAVHRAREASDTILTTVTVGSLRAALARVRQVEAQLAEARARLAEIERQEPFGWLPKWAHDSMTGEMGPPLVWGTNCLLYVKEAEGCMPVYAAPVPAAQVAQGVEDDGELRAAVGLLKRIVDNPENMLGDTLLRANVRHFLATLAASHGQ